MNAIPKTVDRCVGLLVVGKGFEMPCGESFKPTGTDRKCALSGDCPKGHKECWLEKYEEPAVDAR